MTINDNYIRCDLNSGACFSKVNKIHHLYGYSWTKSDRLSGITGSPISRIIVFNYIKTQYKNFVTYASSQISVRYPTHTSTIQYPHVHLPYPTYTYDRHL